MPLTRNIQGHDLSFAVAIVQRRHTRESPQAHTQRRNLQIQQMGGQGRDGAGNVFGSCDTQN